MTDRGDRYFYDILGTCQALHASNCGSSDHLSDDRKSAAVAWLRYRVDTWETPKPHWSVYENAVYGLVMATLAETVQ